MITDTASDTAETHWQRWTMDMQIVVTEPDSLPSARVEVDTELDAVEAAASRFLPDSEINSLATSSGRPTEISELLAEILSAALLAARQTGGDVDPTVGAALIALGYDRDITELDAALDAAIPLATPIAHLPNWSMIQLDDRVVTVPRGVVLDLGATAKAVAADRCARRVHYTTGTGVLVNLGGDIATAGTAPEGGWQVLVQDGENEPASSVALPSGAAMATSSTVRRRWRRNERIVHHILDPRTGQSADPAWRTVSVAAESCLAANTISTAAIVRGWRALDWIVGQNVPARMVDSGGAVRILGGWPADDTGARR